MFGVISNYTLYTRHFTLYTLHFILYTLHFTLYTLHFTLYTLHFTLYTLHFILYALHFTLYRPVTNDRKSLTIMQTLYISLKFLRKWSIEALKIILSITKVTGFDHLGDRSITWVIEKNSIRFFWSNWCFVPPATGHRPPRPPELSLFGLANWAWTVWSHFFSK